MCVKKIKEWSKWGFEMKCFNCSIEWHDKITIRGSMITSPTPARPMERVTAEIMEMMDTYLLIFKAADVEWRRVIFLVTKPQCVSESKQGVAAGSKADRVLGSTTWKFWCKMPHGVHCLLELLVYQMTVAAAAAAAAAAWWWWAVSGTGRGRCAS